MDRERNGYEQAMRANETRAHEQQQRSQVATPDDGEDWPMLSALLAGLTVALLANTFLNLIPS